MFNPLTTTPPPTHTHTSLWVMFLSNHFQLNWLICLVGGWNRGTFITPHMSAEGLIPIHQSQWDWRASAITAATQSAHHSAMMPHEVNRKWLRLTLYLFGWGKKVKSTVMSNFLTALTALCSAACRRSRLPGRIMRYRGWTGSGEEQDDVRGMPGFKDVAASDFPCRATCTAPLFDVCPFSSDRLTVFSYLQANRQMLRYRSWETASHTHIQKHINSSSHA